MEIKYRIIETYPEEHQVLVRFFTNALPESQLVSAWKPDGITPDRYRTDYLVTLPIPAPTGADFDAFILAHCPVYWFDLKTKIADPAIDTSLSEIETDKGVEKTLTATVHGPHVPTEHELAKQARAKAVSKITVTTTAGNTFNGDETSQDRMARAIIALNTGAAPSIAWRLADNTTIDATKEELTEALVLAGQAQSAIWMI